ncbi:hypothetical protein [Endozoicomonas sp. ALC066]|uniref:hypothetical protein n=1 Tax=Endozoicomonas sp. ALC066 TaxID=3403078 RepID=UPI003BB62EFB
MKTNWYVLRDMEPPLSPHKGYIKIVHDSGRVETCHIFLKDEEDNALAQRIHRYVVQKFNDQGERWVDVSKTDYFFARQCKMRIEEFGLDPCSAIPRAAYHWSRVFPPGKESEYKLATNFLMLTPVGMLVEEGRVDVDTALEIVSMIVEG